MTGPDPEAASRFARALVGGREAALTGPDPLLPLFEDAIGRADPDGQAALAVARAGLDMLREGIISENEYYGTINCNGVNPNGEICGITTTSGLSWKIPGRVGDSPIMLADEFPEPWLRISREEAYALCSVAVDLRIHEVVDAPNWVVGAFLPDDIFTGGGNG